MTVDEKFFYLACEKFQNYKLLGKLNNPKFGFPATLVFFRKVSDIYEDYREKRNQFKRGKRVEQKGYKNWQNDEFSPDASRVKTMLSVNYKPRDLTSLSVWVFIVFFKPNRHIQVFGAWTFRNIRDFRNRFSKSADVLFKEFLRTKGTYIRMYFRGVR